MLGFVSRAVGGNFRCVELLGVQGGGGDARQWVRRAFWWEGGELREGCVACVSEKGGVSQLVREGGCRRGGEKCAQGEECTGRGKKKRKHCARLLLWEGKPGHQC